MLFGRETLEKIEEWDNLPEFDNGENFKGKLLDNDSVKNYLWDFHKFYGRCKKRGDAMKENKFEYWITQVDRCELDLVNPRMIYWTSLGCVTRVKMIPPSNIEDLDDMKSWKVIVFHDFHQREPSFYNAYDFIVGEGNYLIRWYANWKKWPLKYKVWTYSADLNVVNFRVECPTSVKKRETWMNNHKPRMTAFNFPKWDKYDDNKNDVKRIDYIRGYFKDDPRAVVVLTLEKKKITWDEARINQWNVGVMNDNGDTDEEMMKNLLLGAFAYDEDFDKKGGYE